MSCPERNILRMIHATFKAQVQTALTESGLTLEEIGKVVVSVLNEVKDEQDEKE